jgi:hypothetical protein
MFSCYCSGDLGQANIVAPRSQYLNEAVFVAVKVLCALDDKRSITSKYIVFILLY